MAKIVYTRTMSIFGVGDVFIGIAFLWALTGALDTRRMKHQRMVSGVIAAVLAVAGLADFVLGMKISGKPK